MEGSPLRTHHLGARQHQGGAHGGQVHLDGDGSFGDQPQVRCVQPRVGDHLGDIGHASAAHQEDDEAAGRREDDPEADHKAAWAGAG